MGRPRVNPIGAVFIGAHVPPEMHAALTELAEAMGVSVSKLVLEILSKDKRLKALIGHAEGAGPG